MSCNNCVVKVWHDGVSDRLVLIVDIWHPDLREHSQRIGAIHDSTLKDRYEAILNRGDLMVG